MKDQLKGQTYYLSSTLTILDSFPSGNRHRGWQPQSFNKEANRPTGAGRRACTGYRALFANKVHVNVTKEASLP